MSKPFTFRYESPFLGKDAIALVCPTDGSVYIERDSIKWFAETTDSDVNQAIKLLRIKPVTVTVVSIDGYSEVQAFDENAMARIIAFTNPVLFFSLLSAGIISEI